MPQKAPKKLEIQVDLTKPRDKRPLVGLDIEQWRGEAGLSKRDAAHALGFRNTNHYNAECRQQVLRFETELLLRIYMDHPGAWERFKLPELFDLMYGQYMKPFVGTDMETFARVDLAERFTALFGKSASRQYEWLDTRRGKTPNANAYIDAILLKLKSVPHPQAVLEETARKCLALRGSDLDTEHPIPTPHNPPERQKTGRQRKDKTATGVVKRRSVKKKPAAKKSAVKKPARGASSRPAKKSPA